MPFVYTEKQVTETTIVGYTITEFTVDAVDRKISGRTLASDDDGNPIEYDNFSLEGGEFDACIASASAIAGSDIEAALKQALYEAINLQTGTVGAMS